MTSLSLSRSLSHRVFIKVLKACADQLSGVPTRIFNLSLTQAIIPFYLNSDTIIPISKKPASVNDYRPKVLTSVVTKRFERVSADHIQASLQPAILQSSSVCLQSKQIYIWNFHYSPQNSFEPPWNSRLCSLLTTAQAFHTIIILENCQNWTFPLHLCLD